MEFFYAALSALPNDAARAQQVRRWLYESRHSLDTQQPRSGDLHDLARSDNSPPVPMPIPMPTRPIEHHPSQSNSLSQNIAENSPPARRRTSLDALARMGLTVTSNLIP